jgi:NADH:ubiquinone oxidoreductase subunit E
MSLEFSAEARQTIEALTQRYPSKQPVVMAALHLARKEFGRLGELEMRAVADLLDLPYPHVYGVATFYTMFKVAVDQQPGRNVVRVCTNISCMLRGGQEVLHAFERRCREDKQFTVVEEECLAACANAPAVICGTKYFLDVTPEQVAEIVGFLREHPHPESEVV